ncbi:hypothetical protein CT19431_MP40020 [Cupriavidus taiwanensis]|nr:hypothetical protein CT19431_MP40020 [Cupriavidus taiwanensis]
MRDASGPFPGDWQAACGGARAWLGWERELPELRGPGRPVRLGQTFVASLKHNVGPPSRTTGCQGNIVR